MNNNSFEQLATDAQKKDVFAISLMGVYQIDYGRTQETVDNGLDLLEYAGNGKNCIWSKNILFGLRVGELEQPVSRHILVESDALEQLRIYADSGNMWAMTAYGNLLYTGYSNPQNKEEGAKYLNMAADRMCYLALELIEDYGIIREPQPTFGKIYDALKNKDYSKFWLK